MTAPGGGGFSFGTPQTQASPFGTAFGGQPVQTSATGMQSAFGAAAPTGGVQPFSFGATPTATVAPTVIAQPFSFGTPATQTGIAQPFSFGTQAAQASTTPTGVVQPFSFGGAATTAPAASVGVSQPFGFGLTATRPQTGGFSFGATQPTTTQAVAATQQSTFGGLGSAAAPTASVAPFFGGFGATATPAASTVPAFGSFGSVPVATSSAAPTGFGGFGTSTAVAPTSFGGFGAPAPTPASTAPTGFGGFGTLPAAATSAAPVGFGGFGTATSVATTTTTSASPFGGLGLSSGVTITPVSSSAPSTGFGTATPSVFPAAPTGSFGVLATTAATPFAGGFGVPTATTAASVVGFGMPAATTAAAVCSAVTLVTGTAMPFGSTPSVSTGFGGFGMVPQVTTTATTPAAVTQSAPSLPIAFGSATTTAAVTTGTATTTVAAVATTTAASLFGSLGATSAPTTTATTVPSFAGFGATTTTPLATVASTASTTTTATTATATTTSATSLFGGIPFKAGAPGLPGFGQTTTTTSTGLSLGSLSATSATGFGQTTTPSVAAPVTSTTTGLGGVDILPASSLPGSAATGKSDKAVKEACLPNEISQTVDAFKKYVTEQKEIREEISRVSSRTIAKVQEETGALRQLLSAVESGVQRNGVSVERLKRETSEDLKHAEIAHHTKETPVALQYENTAPTLYFQKLVTSFGQQMKLYKQQIEELEQHFASLSSTSVLAPEDLITMVNKLHQTFTFLAAQLYSLHEAVQKRKEELLSLSSSGPGGFSLELREKQNSPSGSNVSMAWGPTPFSSQRSDAALAMASALARAGQPTAIGGGILGSLGGQPGLTSTGGTFAGWNGGQVPRSYNLQDLCQRCGCKGHDVLGCPTGRHQGKSCRFHRNQPGHA
ncbi:nuclear pore complex protein Nup58 isoform X2 [Ixodes scapularis]|uniref:nuclear pore complex protein Nup58 isoform X2 n=1 Tax=Ixodes scapularis TaxID=6945 RepID=UPI001C394DA9|nr:nuclear pore complex protein Nup58 isoform X2 [Ixodes scapularis]